MNEESADAVTANGESGDDESDRDPVESGGDGDSGLVDGDSGLVDGDSGLVDGDSGLVEVVRARGHTNVTAEHASTLEVTSDDWLTPAGDCILAVAADRVPADFDDAFVAACQSHDATIIAAIEAGEHVVRVRGRGHPDMSFENERSHVLRTSDYVDDRTVMVDADAAAGDIDRDLVDALGDGVDVTVTFRVEP